MMTSTQENSELNKLKSLYHKTVKIFGPPGTGKTYTLIERVLKNHIRRGTRPQDIAYLSFTNKAVNTAVRRTMESFPNYTSEDFLGKNKVFRSAAEALNMLGCERLDYHQGVKNVWFVKMPKFVDYKNIGNESTDNKKTVSEMDDDFHTGKFRTE